MSNSQQIATVQYYPKASSNLRLFALWYFLVLMTIWNIAGHTFLGFEQAWIAPMIAVTAAMCTQLLLEWIDAKATGRRARFLGSFANLANFLPPAMISGFACGMLLYPNDRIMPFVFAGVISIASKVLFRIRLQDGRLTHFLNPSNFGILATLLLFPSVGQAPPYHFTENITGLWHWILPIGIMFSGIVVHGFATGRLPLCIAWLSAFVIQGVARSWINGDLEHWYVPLTPMSSAGFILFTLYMIPDPATTPIKFSRQILFGASVALMYALFQMNHIVYGLFLALISVCIIRGGLITLLFRPTAVSVPDPQTDSASEPGRSGRTHKSPSTKHYSDTPRPDPKVLAPANSELATVSKS
ncbi:MAG: enediyne biosynthesis protein UnbU [Planctomycetota bacterium]|nr:enediyne biosynthesis protein UnbU [Planctomycetota bacterium]